MKIALIAAVADNNGIGLDNKIPWYLPEDLRYFKSVTMGKPLIMGRKTFDSLKKPLPGRTNIVVTTKRLEHEGIVVAGNIDEAIDIARQVALTNGAEEIMVIGGAHIYRQTLHLADKLYLTQIHKSVTADTFFPDINIQKWHETFCEQHTSQRDETLKYTFKILEHI
ncbi:MAG: dihydrofolate reductase [Endozoicomonadaceae bacterium]|nr:dihydrofolate reductase [Endozoicomonadaceae bacterium]MCY4329551.1 dihydrofolate reductase [Endozoicomonadaceae bacterium]